jgi:DNA-binding transcriptional LysR family regulator
MFGIVKIRLMDKLRTLEFFVAVTDKGSFIEAAKIFGTSPSTISKAIARLEQNLGVQLFVRTTRALRLTVSGQRYLLTVKKLLAELEQSENALRDDNDSVSGTLRINVPISYGRLYIRPLLKGFCAQYPDVNVEIIYDDAYIDIVEKGIDITFRTGSLIDNRLVARKLSPLDFLICAPKGYFSQRQLHEIPTHPQGLLNHRWINFRFKQTGKIMPVMMPCKGEYREYRCDNQYIVDDGEALAELCADGVGLAQMPHFIARRWIREGRIEALYPAYSPSGLGAFALYTKMEKTPKKVVAFVDFVQQWLQSIGEDAQQTWARSLVKP